jgi:hypothetical protein
VFSAVRIPRSTTAAVGIALAYGAGFWLVLLHHAGGAHERAEPPLLLHALRDGTLALPGVLAAVWLGGTLALGLADPGRALSARWRTALLAAGSAACAAVVLAAGNPVHALLFDTQEGHELSPLVHAARDALVALAACLPVAALVLALLAPARAARRLLTAAPTAPPRRGRLTRRAFVRYGAGGLAGTGMLGAGLSRTVNDARAVGATDRLQLYINDGHVPMVDGTLAYMRGYGELPSGDPQPSLTIQPQLFLRGQVGPVASRVYPQPPAAEIPEDGSPSATGIDPSGPGLHTIHRRHWASFFPRRTIVAETGSEIRLRITNRLAEPHTFTIGGVADVTLGPAGSATATRDVEFPAPGPGTYVFHDTANAPVNRVLGLHGVLVVVPADSPWTLDGREGEFERQYVWLFHSVDPEWGRRARLGERIDPAATPAVPRYFTINDRSGVFGVAHSLNEAENHRAHEDALPSGHGRAVDVRDFSDPRAGTGQLIRLVNTGVAVHQPHWHGNHVWTLMVDNEVLNRASPRISPDGHILLQHFEDVVELDPLQTKAVMLPLKPPPNALDVVVANQSCNWVFPMHCHAEMSQTAGGGLYPGGQLADWTLKP